MIESEVTLSETFASADFEKKVTEWGVEMAENEEADKTFWAVAEEQVNTAYPGNSYDDGMTREWILSNIGEATSVADLLDGPFSTYDEIVGLVEERTRRSGLAKEKRLILLEGFLGTVEDPFERYALQEHLGFAPVTIEGLLLAIAQSKANLNALNDLSVSNEGKVVTSVRLGAPHVGRLTGESIRVEGKVLTIPTVPGSTSFYFDANGHPETPSEFIPTENIVLGMRDSDHPLHTDSPENFLRATDGVFGTDSERLHRNTWIVGEIPHGPLYYQGPKDNPHYWENLDFYERRIIAVRHLTDRALSA